MEQTTPILDQALAFLREGFYSVNAVQGLIIALVAAFLMTKWSRLWALALGATIVNIVADVLVPVVAHQAALKLPPLVEVGFWRNMAVLFIGFLLVISILYALRRALIKN